ncbi:MAG: hypothetical protein ABI330_18155 [Caldimonas sp.]
MLRSTTAQEALIAELIGDLRGLIQRAESFETTMDKAQEEMTTAAYLLDSRVEPFRHALAAEIGKTKDIAVKAFIHQTNEVAEIGQRKQTDAMAEGARTVVQKEVVLPLRQFAAVLQRLINETSHPWAVWSTHAATALIATLISGWFVFHFFGR